MAGHDVCFRKVSLERSRCKCYLWLDSMTLVRRIPVRIWYLRQSSYSSTKVCPTVYWIYVFLVGHTTISFCSLGMGVMDFPKSMDVSYVNHSTSETNNFLGNAATKNAVFLRLLSFWNNYIGRTNECCRVSRSSPVG